MGRMKVVLTERDASVDSVNEVGGVLCVRTSGGPGPCRSQMDVLVGTHESRVAGEPSERNNRLRGDTSFGQFADQGMGVDSRKRSWAAC